ncbi:MAG: hypothetical protein J6L03_03320, partial [Bacteroidaceae bacterium]|nr:hypothetical protein [Bacteroidaceae bacterium]
GGIEAVIIEYPVQYDRLFMNRGLPIMKKLVILRCHVVIKVLRDIHTRIGFYIINWGFRFFFSFSDNTPAMGRNKLAMTTFKSGRMMTGVLVICMSPNCSQQYTARSVAVRM